MTRCHCWSRSSCRVAGLLAYLAFVAQMAFAQGPVKPRITRGINDLERVRIQGNIHPLGRPQFDRGKVADSTPMSRVTLFFKPSASQQASLDQLLSEQHDRSSSNYHRWLTPQEFGSRFGLSQDDVSKIVSWLESRGFTVQEVPASRNAVSFSGSAAQVAAAFQTEIHRYVVNGEQHYGNSSEPSIPSALADVVSGIVALNDFRPKPRAIRRTMPLPKAALSDGSGHHYLAPDDFATIYDLKPLYGRAIDGTGQKIAVVGQSDIQLGDIEEFRRLMGLPFNDPQVVPVPGSEDRGIVDGDVQEADLDLEWAGAVARNATLIYVTSSNAWDSMEYAIKNDLAPVVSVSFSMCEQEFSKSDVLRFTLLGEQANVQGQTIVVASGDGGAAGCDAFSDAAHAEATQGLAVGMPASLPYVTAVGGTEFNEGSGVYWNTTNSATDGSALFYIPEVAWNDSSSSNGIEAGGGGASTLFSKPLWQTGQGVPNDSARDVPDLSFSASADHDAYFVCSELFDSQTQTFAPVCPGKFFPVGGTSASAPAFAGIVALLNQAMNSAQGNINANLYALAGLSSGPFHDVTSGSNAVPCQLNPPSLDCPATGSSAGLVGFAAGPKYDMASGLGSVDADALIRDWPSITLPRDFDISVSPPTLTLNRGGVASAQITVNSNGVAGAPSLACNVPPIFMSITCSIALDAATNTYTLTIMASRSAMLYPATTIDRTGNQFSGPSDPRRFTPLIFAYLLGACLIGASITVFSCAGFGRSRQAKQKLVPLFAGVCSFALLIGCASPTSVTTSPQSQQSQAQPLSIQVEPRNMILGQNQQLQFAATVANSSNASVTWSASPAVGTINSAGSAAGIYTAPSTIGTNQTITITATSMADPTKQASTSLQLVAPETGSIVVTGSLNGLSHSVGIALTID